MADVYHKNLVEGDLHVPGYLQSGDPGAVGAGKYWIDTSGGAGVWILKVRNSGDTDWEEVSSSSNGDGMCIDINQASHGFSVGNAIKYQNGSGYIKAQADGDSNSQVIGIVSVVTDASNFTLCLGGKITTLSGLTAGSQYYLDPSTAGALTTTKPTGNSDIVKPLLIAVSATEAYIHIQAGSLAKLYDNLSELMDVALSSPTEKQVLSYDNGSSKWINRNNTLDDLSNINISGATNGQVLKYNLSLTRWENQDESGGGASATRGTFVDGDLSSGVLTITHNGSLSAPYSVMLHIFDNNGDEIIPDDITGATNTVDVDLTSYGTLTGTWGYVYIK